MHMRTSTPVLATSLLTLVLAACGNSDAPVAATTQGGDGGDDGGGNGDGGAPSMCSSGCAPTGSGDAGSTTPADGGGKSTGDAGGTTGCAVPAVTIMHEGAAMTVTPVQHFVDTTTSPLAVCNDGTPATFFTRQGYGGGAKRWLISLEGGGSCYDAATCQARRDGTTQTDFQLTTSNYALTMANGGILSSDPTENADFYDANIVRIHYCSSDSWEGTAAASGATFADTDTSTWSFQGHAIVSAVLQELLPKGLSDADEVILEGESGGGAGVFFNANVVAAALPATTRFVAISDAAIQLSLPNYDASAPGSVSTAPPPYLVDTRATEGVTLWHGTGDPLCTQEGGSPDTCSAPGPLLDGQHFAFPVFVRQSEEDMQKFHDFGAPTPPATGDAAAQAYFTYFEGQQRAFMNALPAPYSAFGPNIIDHIDLLGGTAGQPETFSAPSFTFPDGEMLTTAQAIHQWYANPCTQKLWVQ